MGEQLCSFSEVSHTNQQRSCSPRSNVFLITQSLSVSERHELNQFRGEGKSISCFSIDMLPPGVKRPGILCFWLLWKPRLTGSLMRAPAVSWLTAHKRRPLLALLSERASRALTARLITVLIYRQGLWGEGAWRRSRQTPGRLGGQGTILSRAFNTRDQSSSSYPVFNVIMCKQTHSQNWTFNYMLSYCFVT